MELTEGCTDAHNSQRFRLHRTQRSHKIQHSSAKASSCCGDCIKVRIRTLFVYIAAPTRLFSSVYQDYGKAKSITRKKVESKPSGKLEFMCKEPKERKNRSVHALPNWAPEGAGDTAHLMQMVHSSNALANTYAGVSRVLSLSCKQAPRFQPFAS